MEKQIGDKAALTTPISLRVTSGLASTHPWERALHLWADKIQKETGGKVRFIFIDTSSSIFGTSGPPSGPPDNSPVNGFPGGWQDKFKGADIVGSNAAILGLSLGKVLPAFFYGTDVVTAREVFNKLWGKYPEISDEYISRNIKRLFGHGEVDFYVQTRDKPIRTLNDFNGSTICVLLGELSEVFRELGATEIPVAFGKSFYSEIIDGNINATLGWAEGLVNMDGFNIVRYSTNLHVPLPPQDYYEINPAVWDRLPEDIRQVLDTNNTFIEAEIDKVSLEIEKSAIELAKTKGVEFIELPIQDLARFYSLLEARALRKAAELDAKGFSGTDIFRDTRQLIEEYNRPTGS